ncbi:hypothetical protein WJX77_002351 [Trebouxia sp. C0004]
MVCKDVDRLLRLMTRRPASLHARLRGWQSSEDLAATNPGMSVTLEHKRAATQVVKSLGLQADLRARAVVLAAADSTVGNSLRDLIQLNEDDPALKALVEEFLRGEGTVLQDASLMSAQHQQSVTPDNTGQDDASRAVRPACL